MPARLLADAAGTLARDERYRLSRAGVLNVWQYDEQVFHAADGRLLLRGANGAGKSKTLEMLLPFVLDGDKLHMTASGRHHTSLLWLMTDGIDSGTRTGYLWVEFARVVPDGGRDVLTCGIGVRASTSARAVHTWYFTCPRAVGDDLRLEDAAGPLTKERCRDAVAADGQFFESARPYKEHVGRLLFGLDPSRYDELLRLLYWLRQPQVGEDIEPARLAEILSVALPEIDAAAVRSVGDSLDQLAEFGEQIDRRARAAGAVGRVAADYARYAADVVRGRAEALLDAERERSRRSRNATTRARELGLLDEAVAAAERARAEAGEDRERAGARIHQLETSPEAEGQQLLGEKERRARELDTAAERAEGRGRGDRRRADSARDRRRSTATRLAGEVADVVLRVGEARAALRRCAVEAPWTVPAVLADPTLDRGPDAPPPTGAEAKEVAAGADALAAGLDVAGPAVGTALAAVEVVRAALDDTERADGERRRAEERAADAERREEAAVARSVDAEAAADAAEQEHAARLLGWLATPGSPPLLLEGAGARAAHAPAPPPQTLPPLTPELLGAVPVAARAAAAPVLADARAAEADAGARRRTAERRLPDLAAERARIADERDPSPRPPALPRPSRDPSAGLPLWRLVDLRPDAPEESRALVEAALEASGLLDAQVRADGRVLAPGALDTVLPAGQAAAGPTLADLLAPALPEGSPVPGGVVASVLRRVALAARVDDVPDAPAALGLDGSWRLAALSGRAAKPAAQFLGTAAREAERARRLAAVDQETAAVTADRDRALAEEQAASTRRQVLEAWVAAVPEPTALQAAWVRLRAARDERDRLATDADRRRAQATAARSVAAEARRRLEALAGEHALPTEPGPLAARREALLEARTSLLEASAAARRLAPSAERLRDDILRELDDARSAADAERDAQAARTVALVAAEEYDALLDALGADVQAFQEALRTARAEHGDARRREDEAGRAHVAAAGAQGAAREALSAARQRLAEAEPLVAETARSLARLAEVTGLLPAALGRDVEPEESAAADQAAGVDGSGLPRPVADLARRLASLDRGDRPVTDADLYSGLRDLWSGPAADSDPRVQTTDDGVLALLARDEEGRDGPVAAVAARLAARVAADRGLLTQRERELFEEHLLGELGDRLRTRRREALELVAAMNRLLDGVRTSQGIAVRLDWQLRDDVGEDVRDAVRLLGRPLGALLPEERGRLRDALHGLIEASRGEDPELGYAEHLGRALDYRRWSAFRVTINRPGSAEWTTLTRRTPLSQGEQKVVCYLPLFAAAAAHFTSVAGAAPHAPRLVLLDDAFPKIDVRTHPLLFGLLVDLDLDFVITSERLWGDYATVPALAVYEALRSPTERGIAQYRHVWDGQRLTPVGA